MSGSLLLLTGDCAAPNGNQSANAISKHLHAGNVSYTMSTMHGGERAHEQGTSDLHGLSLANLSALCVGANTAGDSDESDQSEVLSMPEEAAPPERAGPSGSTSVQERSSKRSFLSPPSPGERVLFGSSDEDSDPEPIQKILRPKNVVPVEVSKGIDAIVSSMSKPEYNTMDLSSLSDVRAFGNKLLEIIGQIRQLAVSTTLIVTLMDHRQSRLKLREEVVEKVGRIVKHYEEKDRGIYKQSMGSVVEAIKQLKSLVNTDAKTVADPSARLKKLKEYRNGLESEITRLAEEEVSQMPIPVDWQMQLWNLKRPMRLIAKRHAMETGSVGMHSLRTAIQELSGGAKDAEDISDF